MYVISKNFSIKLSVESPQADIFIRVHYIILHTNKYVAGKNNMTLNRLRANDFYIMRIALQKNYFWKCVTRQCLFKVPDVTLVPNFSLASLCSVMLSSDNRNIMDYWIFNARYCFEYVSLCFWCD